MGGMDATLPGARVVGQRLTPAMLGGLAAASTILAVLAARHTALADSSPVDPSGSWREVWILAAAVGYGAYVVAVWVARRARVRLRLALAVAVVVQLAPLAGPLLLSRDTYLYWAEARLVFVHHANPYRVTPSAHPDDPGTRAASTQWRTQTEPYGPAWVALGGLPAAAAGSSRTAAEVGYRILAAVGIGVLLLLLAFVVRSPSGLIVLGWNPLIALHYAGGGHSDAWMMVALVGALVASRPAVAGALWPVSAAFKGVGVVLMPLDLARDRFRRPRAFWAGLVGVGVAVAVVSTAVFGTGWATGAAEGAHGTSPLGGVHFLGETGLRHRYAVAVCGLVFVAIYAVLLREAWRRGTSRLAFAAAALCMLTSLLRPWYVLWPAAIAAVEGEALGVAATLALTGYALFGDAVP
jgi:hypothetical protein